MSKLPGRLNGLIGEPIQVDKSSPFARAEDLVINRSEGVAPGWRRDRRSGRRGTAFGWAGRLFMRPRRGQGRSRQEGNAK